MDSVRLRILKNMGIDPNKVTESLNESKEYTMPVSNPDLQNEALGNFYDKTKATAKGALASVKAGTDRFLKTAGAFRESYKLDSVRKALADAMKIADKIENEVMANVNTYKGIVSELSDEVNKYAGSDESRQQKVTNLNDYISTHNQFINDLTTNGEGEDNVEPNSNQNDIEFVNGLPYTKPDDKPVKSDDIEFVNGFPYTKPDKPINTNNKQVANPEPVGTTDNSGPSSKVVDNPEPANNSKEPENVNEVGKKIEKAAYPNAGGISPSELADDANNNFYMLKLSYNEGDTKASFTINSDISKTNSKGEVRSFDIFNNVVDYLTPYIDTQGTDGDNKFIVDEEGEMELVNGKWIVTKPIKMRFTDGETFPDRPVNKPQETPSKTAEPLDNTNTSTSNPEAFKGQETSNTANKPTNTPTKRRNSKKADDVKQAAVPVKDAPVPVKDAPDKKQNDTQIDNSSDEKNIDEPVNVNGEQEIDTASNNNVFVPDNEYQPVDKPNTKSGKTKKGEPKSPLEINPGNTKVLSSSDMISIMEDDQSPIVDGFIESNRLSDVLEAGLVKKPSAIIAQELPNGDYTLDLVRPDKEYSVEGKSIGTIEPNEFLRQVKSLESSGVVKNIGSYTPVKGNKFNVTVVDYGKVAIMGENEDDEYAEVAKPISIIYTKA